MGGAVRGYGAGGYGVEYSTDIKQTEVDCYEDSGKTWQAHF